MQHPVIIFESKIHVLKVSAFCLGIGGVCVVLWFVAWLLSGSFLKPMGQWTWSALIGGYICVIYFVDIALWTILQLSRPRYIKFDSNCVQFRSGLIAGSERIPIESISIVVLGRSFGFDVLSRLFEIHAPDQSVRVGISSEQVQSFVAAMSERAPHIRIEYDHREIGFRGLLRAMNSRERG